MEAIANNILKRIRRRKNKVWTPKDFLDLGKRAAVDKALSRLAENGDLRRIGHGLYDMPRFNPILKRPAPVSIDAVVTAIARRDGIRIMPDGSVTANVLGLTNAVPAKAKYVTDGTSRSLMIDGRMIHLRHAGRKVMYWADNKQAGPVVQAIRWLGPQAMKDERALSALKRHLPDPVKQDLIRNVRHLPGWIASVVDNLADSRTVTTAAP